MVHEENSCTALGVLQTCKSDKAYAPPLLFRVLCHIHQAEVQRLPRRFTPSNGHCPSHRVDRADCAEAALHAGLLGIPEHSPHIIALLETHNVKGLGTCRCSDEVAGACIVALALQEKVPPEQVVRQHPDLLFCGGWLASPWRPVSRWDANLAPMASRNNLAVGLPAYRSRIGLHWALRMPYTWFRRRVHGQPHDEAAADSRENQRDNQEAHGATAARPRRFGI
mmetsp:Transcript_54117/g.125889  ORF Transcript_54117/g.125889 Transcript_54117/m.125889 type:complete len:224 (+) Transcript_54117:486-1157(+)